MDEFIAETEKILLNFSKKRYRELLELDKSGQLNDKTREELAYYNDIVLAQIQWEMRDQYFVLLNEYCAKKIKEPTFWARISTL